jgi:hypothetical protein
MFSVCLFVRLLAAAQRLFGSWAVLETHPDDVAWPSLCDYPYGPPMR